MSDRKVPTRPPGTTLKALAELRKETLERSSLGFAPLPANDWAAHIAKALSDDSEA
jgi:hypothetical protein